MNKIYQYILLFCLAVAAIVPGYALADSKDPIVGPWVYTFEVAGNTIEGVADFNADGTMVFHDSGNLTQGLANLAPDGSYFTIVVGSWKKTGDRKYKIVQTAVVLARGIECTKKNPRPGCLAEPAIPFLRIKNEGEFIIRKDLQRADSTSITHFHPVDDLTLTLPAINPATGQPFPDLPGAFTLRKLTF